MNITELSIRRPVTTIMLFVSMVVIGLIASFRLSLEAEPEATIPFFFVNLPYAGSTPEEVERNQANEETRLPAAIDYNSIGGLSAEIRQKLLRHRPETIGQASRIQGMTPAAISILLVYLKRAEMAGESGVVQ